MEYALEMKHIYKSFPGVRVLEDVTLQLKAGEVHALMGENGAGKSTLMKILMGLYHKDQGNILLNGKETMIYNPKDGADKGISMIHQELNTILDMEVAENIFIGRELKKGMNLVDRPGMRQKAQRYFDEMEIDIDPGALMRQLSVAQMQLVEIVKAISVNSKIIIMDEPTSAITEKETIILFKQIRRLKEQGVAIIYISHKMDEIFQIADTISVLRDGQMIDTVPAAEIEEQDLIRMMVGREITEVYPKEETTIGNVVLEVRGLSRGNKVKQADFRLKAGEVLGIAGLVGAGRTELVETVFGMYKKSEGEVFINGNKVSIRSPKDAINQKIALVTEDRKQTGLNLLASVKENISLVSLSKMSKAGFIDKKKEGKAAAHYMDELAIKAPSAGFITGKLSGGNQQKVVLAKWLLTEPDIIIFDEPTRGIDIGSKRDIYLLINRLAKEGKAVIVISSEMPEVMGISDRIIVMCEGRITGEITRDQFSQELIMQYASQKEGK